MNLIDFEVKEIISETKGKGYEVFNAKDKDRKRFPWMENDFIKQECIIVDEGGESKRTCYHDLTQGQEPYKVGYRGIH